MEPVSNFLEQHALSGKSQDDLSMYKERFEHLFRVAKKITSSLNISEILETIRDESKATTPVIHEACLLLIDPEAANYTRPLHCAKGLAHCGLCKKGRNTIDAALKNPCRFLCFIPSEGSRLISSQEPMAGLSGVALPIYHDGQPLAVLDVVSKPGLLLSEKDLILLSDLVELATNVLVNARRHWQISQEKLTLDQILTHLRPFVPQTVQQIVEKNPSAPSLEKREQDVSVLFLDVAGYTTISESLTQEQVGFIIETFFSGFIDIVYRNSGDINETTGDGLMVVFQGDPSVSAWNAAETALAIRKKTMDINHELENRFQPIFVNMGINSGRAAVGMSRFQGSTGTRMTFTASGPVTNVAARIASASKNGDILVGENTAYLLDNRLQTYDRGLMNFKNIRESVRVYSLVRPEE